MGMPVSLPRSPFTMEALNIGCSASIGNEMKHCPCATCVGTQIDLCLTQLSISWWVVNLTYCLHLETDHVNCIDLVVLLWVGVVLMAVGWLLSHWGGSRFSLCPHIATIIAVIGCWFILRSISFSLSCLDRTCSCSVTLLKPSNKFSQILTSFLANHIEDGRWDIVLSSLFPPLLPTLLECLHFALKLPNFPGLKHASLAHGPKLLSLEVHLSCG